MGKGFSKSCWRRILQKHGSRKAPEILQHWETERHNFIQICPKEMLPHLPAPLGYDDAAMPAE